MASQLEKIPPAAVAFAGHSGAGKTSLLERTVAALSARGLKVGYLKANAHRIDLDRQGKDTERLRRAGASAIGITGAGGTAFLPAPPPYEGGPVVEEAGTPHPGPPEPATAAGEANARVGLRPKLPERGEVDRREDPAGHAARALLWNCRLNFEGCDLLLIEGMKASPFPKILVNRSDHPEGILPASSLGGVVLHLLWPTLPEVWDDPVASTIQVLESILRSPARAGAHGVIGAVLAGGGSVRMGEDKARLPLTRRVRRAAQPPAGEEIADRPPVPVGTWLERAFLLVADRVAETWVIGRIARAGGPDLPLLRRPALSHLDLRPETGPLAGMETALAVADGRAALCLPCDLPLLPGEALDRLLEERREESLATAFRHPGGDPEPAVVLLEPAAREPLQRFLNDGGRTARDFLESISTWWLPLSPDLARGFLNLNTPEDRRRFLNDD